MSSLQEIPKQMNSVQENKTGNTSSSLLKDILNPNKNVKIEDYMDDNNKKAMEVAKTQGLDAAVKHMFTHPTTSKPMSYAEMRYYYG